MVKGTRNVKSEGIYMKKPRATGQKVRCCKCDEFKSEGNQGLCGRFGWLIDLELARHQKLCHFG